MLIQLGFCSPYLNFGVCSSNIQCIFFSWSKIQSEVTHNMAVMSLQSPLMCSNSFFVFYGIDIFKERKVLCRLSQFELSISL